MYPMSKIIKIKYRESYPPPQHEHGEEIPNMGIVKSRTRTANGWEYSCINEQCNQTLFYTELDEQPCKKKT